MFGSIDSYIIKKKISTIDRNFSYIATENDDFPWIETIELPNRPLDSVLLFLQTPMNMEKYFTAYAELIRSRKKNIVDDNELNKYVILKKHFSDELPKLLIFNKLTCTEKREHCEKSSFKIKRFAEFLKAFHVVDNDIKPIMLYYSINYFLTFLSDMLLNFSHRKPHHGLSGISNLRIQKKGTFSRIVDGFFALKKPTLFAPCKEKGINASLGLSGSFNRDSDINNDFIKHVKAIKKLYNKYDYTLNPNISLNELINMRKILYKQFKLSNEISNIEIYHENLILIDYLLLFMAGSLARYNPIEWRKIQSAVNDDYEKIRYHINATQSNMLNEWIPYLIHEHILPLDLVNELEIS